MSTAEIGLLLFTVVSFGFDVRVRKIPNALVAIGWLTATALHVLAGDGGGWTVPLFGGIAGFCFALPLYVLGAVGAGDVKWFGAAGAFVGSAGAGMLVLSSVLAGGAAALCMIAASASFRRRCLEIAAGCYVRTGWERWNVPIEGRGFTFPFLCCAGPVAVGYILLN